ncbi:MAG: sugar kinase [Clostridiaceae bacterium]|nr:sugar kinase [Clostridiaceae bacterium]
MAKVVGFGEVMLRLNPEGYRRFVQANCFEASYAGSEANALVTCAMCGLDAAMITKLPENELGQAALNEMRRYGLDTSGILRGGPRLGIYFAEKGASQRDSKVVYDRAGSSIALAKRGEFDWKSIFNGACWFHFSGITPALGGDLAQITMDAVRTAKDMGLTVSCDINYRKKLWTPEEAGKGLSVLMPYVDVCSFNESEASQVFGVYAEAGCTEDKKYESIARQLQERFGFRRVAITLSKNITATDNDIGGVLYENGLTYYSPLARVHIVDRVGAGDCFGGALIVAELAGYTPQHTVNFAAATAVLKCSVEFDYALLGMAEIEALASGGVSAGPQR